MSTLRLNKIDMGDLTSSQVFDGGACDCAIVKISQVSSQGIGASAITYGSQSMTLLGHIQDASIRGNTFQLWGLQNAPSGSITISITITGVFVGGVETYQGVDILATFPNQADQKTSGGSTTDIQIDLTTTEDNCILVGIGGYDGPGITQMFAGSDTTVISSGFIASGNAVSLESNPLVVGVSGTYHLIGATGGGFVSANLSLVVAALVASPASSAAGNFLPFFHP